MQIKVIDARELERRHSYWGYSALPVATYEVLAIKQHRRRTQYLVEDDLRLTWWDADLFNVIETWIPDEWIEIRYSSFHKLQNKKYNFSIAINYYIGPKNFIENEDFLFDIYENPRTAYEYYKNRTGGRFA